MKVLLTGPGGFIGRHAIPHLLSAGFEVHTVDVRPLPDGVSGVTHHIADLLDGPRIGDLTARIGATHLLHFAWYVTPGKYWTSPDNVRWLQSSLDLLTAFLASGGRRSVMAGTCAEYDWTGDGICREAETAIRPASLYGACKAALQMVHEQMARQAGASAAWGRIFHLYGPHEPGTRFVPSLIRSLLRGEPANCTSGRQIRDFMHVDDVARAFVTLLNGSAEGAINIASGAPVALEEVARLTAALVDRADLLRLGALPESAGDPARITADVHRLQALGFTPAWNLEEGLRQTIRWWGTELHGPSEAARM